MQLKRRRELKRTKIEIIPMIDTMFFLLVFFMLSSLSLTRSLGLPVNLPKAATAPKTENVEITITIDANKNLFLNRKAITMANLSDALSQIANSNPAAAETAVTINADESVPHGMVVDCMDAARSVGLTQFAIATKVKEGSS